MADTSSQAEIRGLDIQKLAVAYEQETSIFKKFVRNASTNAREIRWYQKTDGILDSTDTTGITSSSIANTASKARPVVIERSWTRQTSYVKKYMAESPWFADEDIKDSDVDLLAGNMQDIVEGVQYQIDRRIYNVLTENDTPSNINTNASTAAWDAASGQDPIEDIMEAIQNIRTNTNKDVRNGYLFLSPKDHKSLIVWLITTKGSSIPSFASQRVSDGVVMEILGLKVVVTDNVTADKALVCVPDKACVWKSFTPITTAILKEPGIGVKVRVWEEGEAILERPKYVNLITNTQA
jgi:hypothetical protein